MTAVVGTTSPVAGQRLPRPTALWMATAAFAVALGLLYLLPGALASPTDTDPVSRLLGPSAAHPLGTDALGRDTLSRIVHAGQASITLAIAVTGTAVGLGTLLGLVAGAFPRAGAVVMRLMDAWMAFPAIILAMMLAITIGASFWSEFFAMIVIFTPFTARIVRSRVLSLVQKNFVLASGVSGMARPKTLLVHVLPNVLPLALVQAVIVTAQALLVDGALSFLGLGITPPTPTWGNMIAEAQAYLRIAPLQTILPGVCIIMSVLLLNAYGSLVKKAVDPTRA